jgi:teichuronic acid biosynthesis glycosyltransferase TuaG
MALWLLIMKRGFYAYAIQETLAHYRLVSTSNTAKKWKAAKDVWRVYREIEHINLFYSAFCFAGYSINALLKRL